MLLKCHLYYQKKDYTKHLATFTAKNRYRENRSPGLYLTKAFKCRGQTREILLQAVFLSTA
jgi:hypothetical protein